MNLGKLFSSLSKIEKIVLVGSVLIFALSFAFKTSLYVQANTEIKPAHGGTFVEGLIGQPVFINPAIPTTSADRDIARVVFSSLYDVSESIKRSDDGKTWTVRIKQGVQWHDGKPLISDDVIFTLNTIQNRESRSPLISTFQGISAERISELEIKFTLQSPYAFFEEEHLKTLGIMPKHIFNDLEVQNIRLSPYGLKPVGVGPYEVLNYEKDDRGVITSFNLTANKNYFAGEPYIRTLVFKFYKSEEELIKAYERGQIDGFMLSTASNINLLPETRDIKIRHKIYNLHSSRYYAVFINQALGGANLKKIKLREALSRSIDRVAIARDVFQSFASPFYGPTLLSGEESDPYDPTILKDVSLKIVVPEEDFLVKTAEAIETNWERAGAVVELITLPLKTVQEEILKDTNYEMLLFGNIAGSSNDLFSFWHSSKRFYPDPNLALYQNKKVDALLEAFRKNLDTSNRLAKLKELSDTIAADYPAVFLYSPDYIYVTVPSLGGFQSAKTMNVASDRLYGLENWYLKTTRVF